MRVAVAVVAAAGCALAAAACGGSRTQSSSAAATTNAPLAFARCMRAHGVPKFPDPTPQGDFPAFDTGVSKEVSAAADGACRHLLPNGGTATAQQRRQKLEFGVKVSECLRTHGYPDFPAPTDSGLNVPPDVNTRSPQFQATETACEKQVRKALGLS